MNILYSTGCYQEVEKRHFSATFEDGNIYMKR
jgi:hypothetical protein